jgi:F-type H+-transporting ATPase subunit delta
MYEYLDRRYALALYEIAEEKGRVEQYLEELKDVFNIMKDEDFTKLIKHPQVSTSSKKKLFNDIFKNKVDEDILSFLLVLIEKGRILQLENKIKEFQKIYLERNNTVIARVKTVIPLEITQKNGLVDKLQKKYNKNIVLEEELDKDIIGGVYIQINGKVIDDTVKSKLDEMKKLMLKRE